MEKYGKIVDICVSGEGEIPLTHLLTLDIPWSERDIAQISGITYRRIEDSRIVCNPPGSILVAQNRLGFARGNALDVYPSPFLEGIIPDT